MQKRLFLWFSEIGREQTQGFRLVNGSACGLERLDDSQTRQFLRFEADHSQLDDSQTRQIFLVFGVAGYKLERGWCQNLNPPFGGWLIKRSLEALVTDCRYEDCHSPQDAMHMFSFTLGLSGLRISTIVVVMQLVKYFHSYLLVSIAMSCNWNSFVMINRR